MTKDWSIKVHSPNGQKLKLKAHQEDACYLLNVLLGFNPRVELKASPPAEIMETVTTEHILECECEQCTKLEKELKITESNLYNIRVCNSNNLRELETAGALIRKHSGNIEKLMSDIATLEKTIEELNTSNAILVDNLKKAEWVATLMQKEINTLKSSPPAEIMETVTPQHVEHRLTTLITTTIKDLKEMRSQTHNDMIKAINFTIVNLERQLADITTPHYDTSEPYFKP